MTTLEVVQLRSANLTLFENFYLINGRRHKWKDTLYANAVRNLPDCKRGTISLATALYDSALELLNPFFIPLFYLNVNVNCISRLEIG